MPDTKHPPTPPPQPSLYLNWEDWLPYVDDDETPYEARREFIETIWFIAMAFVDLGWNIRSGPETCGQDFDLAAALRRAVSNSKQDHLPFGHHAAGQIQNAEEEV